MGKGKYENVIFDLDGTLIHSASEIMLCLKNAFIECKIDQSLYSAHVFDENRIGPPLDVIVGGMLPLASQEEKRLVMETFKRIYDQCGFSKTEMYEGVREALSHLDGLGKFNYLATHKRKGPTQKILEVKKLGPFRDTLSIDTIPGQSLSKSEMLDLLKRKWNLEKETMVMVGDTVVDLEAAHQFGIDSVAFLGGYGKESELLEYKPTYVIREMSELLISLGITSESAGVNGRSGT